jgi:hypothetical protein
MTGIILPKAPKATSPLLVLNRESDQQMQAIADRPYWLPRYKHFDRVRRNIRVIGSWVRELDPKRGRDWVPALVLVRPKAPIAIQIPCIVRLDTAWMWADAPLGDPIATAAMACDFCNHLGLDLTRNKDVVRVLMVIQDHIDDLLKIPPSPPAQKIVDGEIELRLETGQIITSEAHHYG